MHPPRKRTLWSVSIAYPLLSTANINIPMCRAVRYSEVTCPLTWQLLRIFTRMLIMLTMSYLIDTSAWGWLVYSRARRESINVITVIGGIFFRRFSVELRRHRTKNGGILARIYSVLLGGVNADGKVLSVEC